MKDMLQQKTEDRRQKTPEAESWKPEAGSRTLQAAER
jgi:hypothetical protein